MFSILLWPKAACLKPDKFSPQCRIFINVYIIQFFFRLEIYVQRRLSMQKCSSC